MCYLKLVVDKKNSRAFSPYSLVSYRLHWSISVMWSSFNILEHGNGITPGVHTFNFSLTFSRYPVELYFMYCTNAHVVYLHACVCVCVCVCVYHVSPTCGY